MVDAGIVRADYSSGYVQCDFVGFGDEGHPYASGFVEDMHGEFCTAGLVQFGGVAHLARAAFVLASHGFHFSSVGGSSMVCVLRGGVLRS